MESMEFKVDVNELFARIGYLTVEKEKLEGVVKDLQAKVASLEAASKEA